MAEQANRMVEYNVYIFPDGRIMKEVTNRNKGDCRVVDRIGAGWGNVLSEEQTGPFCDTQNETSGER